VLVHYAGVEFVASARVRGTLYDFGAYPGLRLDPAAGWVHGEIFEVTAAALAGLDDWEGIDPAAPEAGEYLRVRVTVERDDGTKESCWVYEMVDAKCASGVVIESGDWLARALI
jgi:gamma-glutamylcyclotransferase (GGCT)/AIG2-like uncharacterized protein YtfP